MYDTHADRNRVGRLTTSRRAVLSGLATLAGVGALGATPVWGQEIAPYSVVQGDRCLPITPLAGSVPVEELYGLRVPERFEGDNGALRTTEGPFYESTGTTDLQRVDTTVTFLYDGPEGLSLVVVHDHADDGGIGGTGGSVTWTLSGLPATGEWAVKDSLLIDPTTGEAAAVEADLWDLGGPTHTIDWTWGRGSTDGGAFRGLGDAFEVTIDPAYNEAATLWGVKSGGRVTDWQALSGSRASPTRHSLALEKPVTIRSGGCVATVGIRIDVRPGSDRNPVNPKSRGGLPVAIHGSGAVDPEAIDVATLRFGAPSAVDAGRGASPTHDGHGSDPLVVHFPTGDAGFGPRDTRATLVGETNDGTTVVGSDDVTIVGNGDGSRSPNDAEGRSREKAEKRQEREEREDEKRREREERDDEEEEKEEEEEVVVDEDDEAEARDD